MGYFGEEKYRSLIKLFLNETYLVILVYFINEYKTFEELNYLNQLCSEELGDNIILGVVGNKTDLILNQ